MKLIVVFAALIVAVASSPAINPYVMHGREAKPDEFPFAVGILLHFEEKALWCSGSLISANYVLTAAKCLEDLEAATIYLGAHRFASPAQTIVVSKSDFKIHDGFDAKTEENDIALIRLPRPANLDHPMIDVVRLPRKSERSQSFNNKLSSVYGWGYAGHDDFGARRGETPIEYLHAANETTMTNAACLLRYPAYIHNSNICTHTDEGTPCDGDEGGALLLIDVDLKFTQIGVHSYTFSLGCTWGWPAVHTRITYYMPWLENYSDVVLRP